MKKAAIAVVIVVLAFGIYVPLVEGWRLAHHEEMARDALNALKAIGGLPADVNVDNIADHADRPDELMLHPLLSCHRVRDYQDKFEEYGGSRCDHPGAEWWAAYYLTRARDAFVKGDREGAEGELGYAIHYIQDALNPPHVFPFEEKFLSGAHWNFEGYTEERYLHNERYEWWRIHVREAKPILISSSEDLSNKIKGKGLADKGLADWVYTLSCSYRSQKGEWVIDFRIEPTPEGLNRHWDMRDDDIRAIMEKAAGLVKGAAIWVFSAPTPPVTPRGRACLFDKDGNDRLDDEEILEATKKWISGEPVGGKSLTDEEILEFINDWISGEKLGCRAEGDRTPRVSVSPSSGPAGTKFSVQWEGFTPNSTLTSHLQKPDGTEFPTLKFNTNSQGKASHTIDSTGFTPGTYTLWAIDKATGIKTVNIATFTVTSPPPPEKRPPKADFTFSPSEPKVNETVYFTDRSTDPDNDITSWSWDFGDGSTSTSQNPSHSYSQAGTYTVKLTVRDKAGNSDSTSKAITVRELAPPPNLAYIVRLKHIVRQGKTRAILGVHPKEGPLLSLYDGNGRVCTVLGMEKGIPCLALYDENGRTRVLLTLPNGMPGLIFFDENENAIWSAP